MGDGQKKIYRFEQFTLDLSRGSLTGISGEVRLRPKAFDVLRYLVENNGRLIAKDELIDAIWSETAVTDDSLVQCMKDIRRALDDSEQKIIRTIPRRGYIFDANVAEDRYGLIKTEEIEDLRVVIEEIKEKRHASSRDAFLSSVKHHRYPLAFATLIVMIAAGITYGLFSFYRRSAGAPIRSIGIKRLTHDGKAIAAAISRDGNYVAYVVGENGRQSLWIRQTVAANGKQIVEPAEIEYVGLTFSPDGNFVNYVADGALYRMPTLGGTVRRVWDHVSSKITYSPDGSRIAYIRDDHRDGTRLILANADGTGEPQTLALRMPPNEFKVLGSCSWSPDGLTIACAVSEGGAGFGLEFPLAVRVKDGHQTILTAKPWNFVKQMDWLADGSGIIMHAFDNLDPDSQLWHVSFPGGIPTRLYNDLHGYAGVSLTSNSEHLVTLQREPQLSIHAVDPYQDPERITKLTTRTAGVDGWEGVTTTPDDRIVYYSENDDAEIWIMDADGGNKKQLTSDKQRKSHFTVSPDGQHIAYGLAGQGIWMIDSDGNNRRQVTDSGMFPYYSPDGKWIVYSLRRDKWSMRKISPYGGEPIRLTETPAIQPAVSPDGRLIAFADFRPRLGTKELKVMPFEGGEAVKVSDLKDLGRTFQIEWTPDGKALTYNIIEDGLHKIVNQPLDGGPRQVLMSAKSEHETISAFAWSRNGNKLVFSAGPETWNVVIFTLSRS